MSSGIKIFATLEEAQAAGFKLYDTTPEGYLVRRDDGHTYALALVKIQRDEPAKDPVATTEDAGKNPTFGRALH